MVKPDFCCTENSFFAFTNVKYFFSGQFLCDVICCPNCMNLFHCPLLMVTGKNLPTHKCMLFELMGMNLFEGQDHFYFML